MRASTARSLSLRLLAALAAGALACARKNVRRNVPRSSCAISARPGTASSSPPSPSLSTPIAARRSGQHDARTIILDRLVAPLVVGLGCGRDVRLASVRLGLLVEAD